MYLVVSYCSDHDASLLDLSRFFQGLRSLEWALGNERVRSLQGRFRISLGDVTLITQVRCTSREEMGMSRPCVQCFALKRQCPDLMRGVRHRPYKVKSLGSNLIPFSCGNGRFFKGYCSRSLIPYGNIGMRQDVREGASCIFGLQHDGGTSPPTFLLSTV